MIQPDFGNQSSGVKGSGPAQGRMVNDHNEQGKVLVCAVELVFAARPHSDFVSHIRAEPAN
jgi:hypothetical protein